MGRKPAVSHSATWGSQVDEEQLRRILMKLAWLKTVDGSRIIQEEPWQPWHWDRNLVILQRGQHITSELLVMTAVWELQQVTSV